MTDDGTDYGFEAWFYGYVAERKIPASLKGASLEGVEELALAAWKEAWRLAAEVYY